MKRKPILIIAVISALILGCLALPTDGPIGSDEKVKNTTETSQSQHSSDDTQIELPAAAVEHVNEGVRAVESGSEEGTFLDDYADGDDEGRVKRQYPSGIRKRAKITRQKYPVATTAKPTTTTSKPSKYPAGNPGPDYEIVMKEDDLVVDYVYECVEVDEPDYYPPNTPKPTTAPTAYDEKPMRGKPKPKPKPPRPAYKVTTTKKPKTPAYSAEDGEYPGQGSYDADEYRPPVKKPPTLKYPPRAPAKKPGRKPRPYSPYNQQGKGDTSGAAAAANNTPDAPLAILGNGENGTSTSTTTPPPNEETPSTTTATTTTTTTPTTAPTSPPRVDGDGLAVGGISVQLTKEVNLEVAARGAFDGDSGDERTNVPRDSNDSLDDVSEVWDT